MKIKLRDYELIYKTINSVLLSENADPTGACTFFNYYGAYLLREHYKIDADAFSGMCFYHLGGDNNVLGFGSMDENSNFSSAPDAFHCWVLAEDWLIDFMAPVFPDLLKSGGFKFGCSSKMIQKPISSMRESPYELKNKGDFYYQVNPDVTNERTRHMLSKPAYADLADICKNWYRKPPRKMLQSIPIGDNHGNFKTIRLTGNKVVGAW